MNRHDDSLVSKRFADVAFPSDLVDGHQVRESTFATGRLNEGSIESGTSSW